MDIPNLVLFHKGPVLPHYLFDCLYQICLVQQKTPLQTYILTDKIHHKSILNKIQTFYLPLGNKNINNINCVDIHSIKMSQEHLQFNKTFELYETKFPDTFHFRNGFWRLSLERFFYLADFIQGNSLKNVFHTENDIMMYTNLNVIKENIKSVYSQQDTLYILKDSPTRGIGSFMFSFTKNPWIDFCQFVNSQLKTKFSNDMTMLGTFPNCITLPDSPNHSFSPNLGIFDAACIGQYLGGTDPRKGDGVEFEDTETQFDNPTKGFINETSVFKPNVCRYMNVNDRGIKKWMLITDNGSKYPIHNLHIHSKNLYEFSSVFSVKYTELPSPKNFMKNCDFVFGNKKDFDKNPKNLFGNVVLLEKNNFSSSFLKKIIMERTENKNIFSIRLFLQLDYESFLYFIETLKTLVDIPFQVYIYNYTLTKSELLSIDFPECVTRIYNPNIDSNVTSDKYFSLPLCITNENQMKIYKNMINTYYTCPSQVKVYDQNSYWKCLFEGNVPVMNGTKFQSSLFKFDKYEININFYL